MNIVLGRICVGRSHVMFYLLGDIVFLFFVGFFLSLWAWEELMAA